MKKGDEKGRIRSNIPSIIVPNSQREIILNRYMLLIIINYLFIVITIHDD